MALWWLLLLLSSVLVSSADPPVAYNKAACELYTSHLKLRGFISNKFRHPPETPVVHEDGRVTFVEFNKLDGRLRSWSSYVELARNELSGTSEYRFSCTRRNRWVDWRIENRKTGYWYEQRPGSDSGFVVFWLARQEDEKILDCAAQFDPAVDIDAESLYKACKAVTSPYETKLDDTAKEL